MFERTSQERQKSPIRSKRLMLQSWLVRGGDDATDGHSLQEAFQDDTLKRAQTAWIQYGSVEKWSVI